MFNKIFNKIIFYILFLLIKSSLLQNQILQLPEYGSITVSWITEVYLSLDNFKSKDTLYFEASFYSKNNYSSIFLGFLENDNNYYSYTKNFDYISSQLNFKSGNSYTFYFSYTLKKNKNYLLISTQTLARELLTHITFKHIKEIPDKEQKYNSNNGNDIVGGIICIVIDVTAFIALNIILCRHKRKNEESELSINVNKSIYTSQPAFTQPQPLYDQSQTPAYE